MKFFKKNNNNDNLIIEDNNPTKRNNKTNYIKALIISGVVILMYLIGNIFQYLNKKDNCSIDNNDSVSLRKQNNDNLVTNEWEYLLEFSPENLEYNFNYHDESLYVESLPFTLVSSFPNFSFNSNLDFISVDYSSNSSNIPFIEFRQIDYLTDFQVILYLDSNGGLPGGFKFEGYGYLESGSLNGYSEFTYHYSRNVYDIDNCYFINFNNKCRSDFDSSGFYHSYRLRLLPTTLRFNIKKLVLCIQKKDLSDFYFNSGYNTGYSDGLDIGQENGFNDGYDIGHTDGYNTGYSDGRIFGEKNNLTLNVSNLLTGFFASIASFFLNVGNYSFFGVSIIDLVGVIVLIYLVYTLIKLFSKG